VAVRPSSIALCFLVIVVAGWTSLGLHRPPPAAAPSADPPSAAVTYHWGEPDPQLSFDFTGAGMPSPSVWNLYRSAGHAGNGLRRPEQITLHEGYVQIAGLADATSGGMMSWAVYPPFGRWEVRMRVDGRGLGHRYHAVVALIPDGVPYDGGAGDLDFAEADVDEGRAHVFIHYPPRKQTYASVPIDLAEWHAYAIELAPDHISWFVDGTLAMTTTIRAAITGARWTTNIQLDAYYPGDLAPSNMQVDYLRYYPLPEDGARLLPGPVPTTDNFR
jgi:hypothetical protein